MNRDARFLVGETDAYEARCRLHWDPRNFEPGRLGAAEPLSFSRDVTHSTACASIAITWRHLLMWISSIHQRGIILEDTKDGVRWKRAR